MRKQPLLGFCPIGKFVFSHEDGVPRVKERKPPYRLWPPPGYRPTGSDEGIYGVVSRIFHPTTGNIMIGIAGISHNGTRAAAEFATNDALLTEALRTAPADWDKKNLQVVLQVRVIGNTPAPPKVVALDFW